MWFVESSNERRYRISEVVDQILCLYPNWAVQNNYYLDMYSVLRYLKLTWNTIADVTVDRTAQTPACVWSSRSSLECVYILFIEKTSTLCVYVSVQSYNRHSELTVEVVPWRLVASSSATQEVRTLKCNNLNSVNDDARPTAEAVMNGIVETNLPLGYDWNVRVSSFRLRSSDVL